MAVVLVSVLVVTVVTVGVVRVVIVTVLVADVAVEVSVKVDVVPHSFVQQDDTHEL